MIARVRRTPEEQRKVVLDFCKDIQDTDDSLDIVRKRHDVGHLTVARYACANPELKDIYNEARATRGWRYAERALQVLRDCDPFYESKTGIKDSMAIVNKTKFYADALFRFAAAYDPLSWGEMRYELKALQVQLEFVKKALVDRGIELDDNAALLSELSNK